MRKALIILAFALGATGLVAPSASAAPTVTLSGASTAVTGTATKLQVKAARSLAGERVVLKKRIGGEWQRVARKTLGPRGYATFYRTHSVGGTHRYRAHVHALKSNRLFIVVQAPVVIDAPPPADAPPPTVAPPPESTTPPSIVPALPVLPPYPGGGAAFSGAKATNLMTDNLDCGIQGYVGTRHLGGVGNGYEWEYWAPTLWYYNYSSGWTPLVSGSFNYRDSAPHPFSTSGNAWLIYPSGATNAYAQWYWPVTRGYWYAVGNYNYADSYGWGRTWGHEFESDGYPAYCYAY